MQISVYHECSVAVEAEILPASNLKIIEDLKHISARHCCSEHRPEYLSHGLWSLVHTAQRT